MAINSCQNLTAVSLSNIPRPQYSDLLSLFIKYKKSKVRSVRFHQNAKSHDQSWASALAFPPQERSASRSLGPKGKRGEGDSPGSPHRTAPVASLSGTSSAGPRMASSPLSSRENYFSILFTIISSELFHERLHRSGYRMSFYFILYHILLHFITSWQCFSY